MLQQTVSTIQSDSFQELPVPRGDEQQCSPLIVALIPAYNEERFIGSLVLDVRTYVSEVIVVDDGSSDRTAAIARSAGATVLQHPQNRGKAAAVNTGFAYLRNLRPDVTVMLDGDGQHYAEDIPAVVAPVLEGAADIVVGSRYKEIRSSIPLYRRVGQHGLNLATNLASGVHLSDTQSGYRAFSLQALEQLSFGQNGFSMESEMQFLANEHNLRLSEVPIKVLYSDPPRRNPFAHGMQVLSAILQLVGQVRPLLFFSLLALPLLLGGTLLGLYVVEIFIRTRQLAVGYALITVLLCEIGVLLFFTGIILHSTRGMLLEMQRSMLGRLRAEESR